VLKEIAEALMGDGGPGAYKTAVLLGISDDELVEAVASQAAVKTMANVLGGSASDWATFAVSMVRSGWTSGELLGITTSAPGHDEHFRHNRASDPVMRALQQKLLTLGKSTSGEWRNLSRDEFLEEHSKLCQAKYARCAYLDARGVQLEAAREEDGA
jgi:hypothetical protein